ncbi:unnamed protein product [Mytilus edulis]|uniref:Ig-like domain-containing protein n=1 Tax=Mytilus edulis TaxID=6550 RepID=A0A8S3PXP4_MYTED|nr:unnamed protein product [Mytilus edulis]
MNQTMTNTTLYFENGSTAILVCPLVNDTISWTGPPDKILIAVGEQVYKGAPIRITIDDETAEGCIFGYLGRELNITCRINSGNPLGTLYWTYNNSVVKTSTSSNVTYSFKPSTDHNFEEFSCAANNKVLSQRNIKICLYLPPTVQITPGRFVSVVEGTQRELKCIFSSNNEVKNISWVYNDKPLQKWFNCSRIQLVNVNQSQAENTFVQLQIKLEVSLQLLP